MLHAIVMAGGAGTRFWPASRVGLPKQLLPLAGERSLLEDTVERLDGLVPPERVLIVTSARLLDAARHQLPQVPPHGLVGEPCKRDTAPCIGLAALLVSRTDPDATMAVMPSDHVIGPVERFQAAIRQAAALVDATPERLVTFGIRPTHPAEGFGYIPHASMSPRARISGMRASSSGGRRRSSRRSRHASPSAWSTCGASRPPGTRRTATSSSRPSLRRSVESRSTTRCSNPPPTSW